jgi:hypothetical protein
LFNYRVVVYHIAKAVVWDGSIEDREKGSRDDQPIDFFGFRDEPEMTVGAGFRRGVRKGFAVEIQIQYSR